MVPNIIDIYMGADVHRRWDFRICITCCPKSRNRDLQNELNKEGSVPFLIT